MSTIIDGEIVIGEIKNMMINIKITSQKNSSRKNKFKSFFHSINIDINKDEFSDLIIDICGEFEYSYTNLFHSNDNLKVIMPDTNNNNSILDYYTYLSLKIKEVIPQSRNINNEHLFKKKDLLKKCI